MPIENPLVWLATALQWSKVSCAWMGLSGGSECMKSFHSIPADWDSRFSRLNARSIPKTWAQEAHRLSAWSDSSARGELERDGGAVFPRALTPKQSGEPGQDKKALKIPAFVQTYPRLSSPSTRGLWKSQKHHFPLESCTHNAWDSTSEK